MAQRQREAYKDTGLTPEEIEKLKCKTDEEISEA